MTRILLSAALAVLVSTAALAAADGFDVGAKVDRKGFTEVEKDGKLFVFKDGSAELTAWQKDGTLPADAYTGDKAGPGGKTVVGPNYNVVLEYLATRESYAVFVTEEGRLWVFRSPSKELTDFRDKKIEPEKHTTVLGAGPLGATVKAVTKGVIEDWAAGKTAD